MSLQMIIFTDNAAKKVNQLIQEEDNPALNLRVFVQGGGCSGFQYGFTFDDVINEDDTVIKKLIVSSDKQGDDDQGDDDQGDGGSSGGTEVKLLIDPMSLQYLAGAEIDYREDVKSGAQFVIRNPNAKTTCGCGSSFSA